MSYIFGEHPFEKFLKLQAERQRAQKEGEEERGRKDRETIEEEER